MTVVVNTCIKIYLKYLTILSTILSPVSFINNMYIRAKGKY